MAFAAEIGPAGRSQGVIADAAAVAHTAGFCATAVATPGVGDRHIEAQGFFHDPLFAPGDKRRPVLRPAAFAAHLAAQIGVSLKGGEIVGASVGIAGVIDRIHPQHDAIGAAGLRQAEADADEHRVAPRHVGAGDDALLHAIGGDDLLGVGEG